MSDWKTSEVCEAVSRVGKAGVPGRSSGGGCGGATPPPLRVCPVGGTFRLPPAFLFPCARSRIVLQLRDLILHRQEAGMSVGVAAQTEVWVPCGLLVKRCKSGDWRSEGSGKIVQDLAGEFAGRKGGGSGTYPGPYPGPYVPQQGAPQPGARLPASCAQCPPTLRNCLTRRLPESPPPRPRVDVGRGAARSSRR